MSTGYRNRPHIAQQSPQLAEALDDLLRRINTMAQQTNANPTGEPPQPPQVGALNVAAAGGIVHAQITDNSPVTRGIIYHFEASTTPNFSQPTLLQSGPSRDYRGALGAQPIYMRAYSQYPSGKPSAPVFHGTPNSPTKVEPGGLAGPAYPPSKGSGTAPTSGTLGGAGFGQTQTRTETPGSTRSLL
jgi:hypothetical protein